MFYLLNQSQAVDYDETRAMVVRAGSEDEARRAAYGLAFRTPGSESPDIWADPERSTCEPLAADGPVEVILVDTKAG